MLQYLLFITLVVGLLMFIFCKKHETAKEIGRMMFFAALVGLMFAYGPTSMALLRH